MTTIAGLPAHPLIVHAVVVLLPLAAFGALLVAARPAWRRSLGGWVLLIALVGLVGVPLATQSGEQLEHAIGGENPLIEIHEARAERLLPLALLFTAGLLATLLLGRRADRADRAAGGDGGAATAARLTTAAAVLTALLGIVVAAAVIWIGHAGATAVWQGVGTG